MGHVACQLQAASPSSGSSAGIDNLGAVRTPANLLRVRGAAGALGESVREGAIATWQWSFGGRFGLAGRKQQC